MKPLSPSSEERAVLSPVMAELMQRTAGRRLRRGWPWSDRQELRSGKSSPIPEPFVKLWRTCAKNSHEPGRRFALGLAAHALHGLLQARHRRVAVNARLSVASLLEERRVIASHCGKV